MAKNKEEEFYRTLLDNLYDGVYFVDRDRNISYWNKGAERITGYTAEEVKGMKCTDNLLMHVDKDGKSLCLGACPLTESLVKGCSETHEIFLLHKDGHRVPVSVRVSPIRNEKGEIVGAVEIFTDNTSRSSVLERMAEFEQMAYVDPLTGVANRRFTEIALSSRLEEMQRYGWPFGVIFIDIDDFKLVNDRYGHEIGDEVLKMVTKTISHSARSFDVVGRWGGEEFLVVVANVTRGELARTAERFRFLVQESKLPVNPPLSVTISLGVTRAREGDTVAEILRRADRLLYESKTAGKNRVTID